MPWVGCLYHIWIIWDRSLLYLSSFWSDRARNCINHCLFNIEVFIEMPWISINVVKWRPQVPVEWCLWFCISVDFNIWTLKQVFMVLFLLYVRVCFLGRESVHYLVHYMHHLFNGYIYIFFEIWQAISLECSAAVWKSGIKKGAKNFFFWGRLD